VNADWLPIGNGKLGAMMDGGVMTERIQFNEESLWSGGPGGQEQDGSRGPSTAEYNYGYNAPKADPAAMYAALEPINGTTSPGSVTAGSSSIASQIQGNYNGYGKYKNFGYLNLDHLFPVGMTEVADYRRELDLADSASRVTYKIGDIEYTREYIASYPGNVVAMRFSASDASQINLGVSVTPGQPTGGTVVAGADGTLTLTGALTDNDLLYAGVWKVVNEGGALSVDGDQISVGGADAVTILFSAATDYQNEYTRTGTGYGAYSDAVTTYGAGNDETAFQMTYRTGETAAELVARVSDVVQTASAKSYADVLGDHQADYQELFDRVSFDIGGENTVPTDTMLAAYRTTTTDTSAKMLETILYQYGRYLLISSSREGSLAANLQGVWNNSNTPPWSADYHYNINLQMNYWPAGAGNLLETMEPLQKLIESLRVTGRYTAQKYSYDVATPADAWKTTDGSAGWTMHVSGNPYGMTTPGYTWSWGWSSANNASLSQNLYQYLQYGGDKAVYQEHYWPIIREAAVMWTKALYKPTTGRYAGKYVVTPSYSPEHGPLTIATAYDQQLVYDLFTLTLDSMDQLGLGDDAGLRTSIEEKLANFYPPAEIGSSGTIKEWSAYSSNSGVPGAQAEGTHRHMSHMIGYYPGTSVSGSTDPAIQEAALDTLQARGLEATGWSMGWKINLWARARDGETTHQLINNLISKNMSKNLFDQHPPFQIDGNFGYTAGIHEMLMQSYTGTVDLLPALPSGWGTGSIDGLRANGGHTVGVEWADGEFTKAHVTAASTDDVVVRNTAFASHVVTVDGVPSTVTDSTITIPASAGTTYEIALADVPILGLSQTDKHVFADSNSPLEVTASNTGSAATGALSVTLSGPDASSFELSTPTLAALAAGGSAKFSVKPKAGLDETRVHKATVTVTDGTETKTFQVS
jgi:alpha-L-fucosidase 2